MTTVVRVQKPGKCAGVQAAPKNKQTKLTASSRYSRFLLTPLGMRTGGCAAPCGTGLHSAWTC